MPDVPPQFCPKCNHKFELASSIDNNERILPEEGSISICIGCGHLQVFKKDLTLRSLTPLEVQELAEDERISKAVQLIKRMRRFN